MGSGTIRDNKYIFNWVATQLVLLVCLNQYSYHFADAQFFGTGSSRLDNSAQEVVKEMAHEFAEIIEDKE